MKDYINDLTKQIWESSEINWSPGNGEKSYGEAVYDWWDKLLTEDPSKYNIGHLKNYTNKLEVKIGKLEENYTGTLLNTFQGQESELSVLELIELYKEALHHLNKLKVKYVKPVLTLEERVQRLVDNFSPNSNSKVKQAYTKYVLFLAENHWDKLDQSNPELIKAIEKNFGAPLVREDRRIKDLLSAFKREQHQIKPLSQ